MIIEAAGLKARLGGREILKGLDFRLQGPAFIGLLGPNGSGKSTLLKTIYRALPLAGGRLSLDGRDAAGLTRREMARLLAVLPQRSQAELDFSVEETALMGRYPHRRLLESLTGADRALAAGVLAGFGLSHLSPRPLVSLSGGERQLALLARAFVQDTPGLLLDEPTNHLDPSHQLAFLDHLAGAGKLIVAVFHDLNLAGKYCDYLYLLKAGRFVAQGPPAAALTRENIKSCFNMEAEIIIRPDGGRPAVLF